MGMYNLSVLFFLRRFMTIIKLVPQKGSYYLNLTIRYGFYLYFQLPASFSKKL